MSSVNVGAMVGTAAGLGVVHVLTGPDHLSAITTLSANVRTRQAFGLGIRWGVGHSLGLLLVGIILIAVTSPVKNAENHQQTDGEGGSEEVVVPHTVETVFESLVGVFMLLLGSYGIHRAVRRRRARAKARDELLQDEEQQEEDERGSTSERYLDEDDDEEASGDGLHLACEGGSRRVPEPSPDVVGEPFTSANAHVLLRGTVGLSPLSTSADGGVQLDGEGSSLLMEPHGDDARAFTSDNFDEENSIAAAGSVAAVDETSRANAEGDGGVTRVASASDDGERVPPTSTTTTTGRCRCHCLSYVSERLSTGLAALLIGTVHGLAGPGGVLGVIPAVQLRDWKLALLYLGTFCIVSTITMGIFATVFGTISSKLVDRSAARLEFCIEFFPSCLSIAVGILWLILSPMGKLEEIFG